MSDGENRCRVVLCDDAVDYLELVKISLAREGHFEIVGEAFNGIECVSQCKALQPDVLLLDVSMPEMDGLTALPLVREASPHTNVVLLSGFSSDDIKRKANELGAVAFIEKGITPTALTVEVLAHCHRKV